MQIVAHYHHGKHRSTEPTAFGDPIVGFYWAARSDWPYVTVTGSFYCMFDWWQWPCLVCDLIGWCVSILTLWLNIDTTRETEPTSKSNLAVCRQSRGSTPHAWSLIVVSEYRIQWCHVCSNWFNWIALISIAMCSVHACLLKARCKQELTSQVHTRNNCGFFFFFW